MRSLLPFCMLCVLIGALTAHARPAGVALHQGKLYINGRWTFLKIAKPLLNFADAKSVADFIPHLRVLKKKNYNVIEINCYWHHFDRKGDATNLPTGPLREFINAVEAAGMLPCLSVETYGVGGGQIPQGFWDKHPEAIAIDSDGKPVRDDEYGVMSQVPSLFSRDYLRASRAFIWELTRSIPHEKILWFETTVEPQFMGNHALDFSPHARREWTDWLKRNNFSAPAMPVAPVPETFLNDPTWNRFRAEWLAEWINQDAAVFREIAGQNAYVAVDYLETCGPDMRNRNGDSLTFLRHLTAPNIIQVNWHWRVADRKPNQCAYDNVRLVMKELKRDWAISEHMTINGTDYRLEDMPDLLRNTIRQGTGLGWEFVSVTPSDSPFAVYNPDWSPRPTMAVIDDHWTRWLREIQAAHRP